MALRLAMATLPLEQRDGRESSPDAAAHVVSNNEVEKNHETCRKRADCAQLQEIGQDPRTKCKTVLPFTRTLATLKKSDETSDSILIDHSKKEFPSLQIGYINCKTFRDLIELGITPKESRSCPKRDQMQQADRSLRSVFVGNIPYDATEEKLRDIFGAVGPVLSFRIVFDRDTGKPKGYGFCEYKDEETATSAIRNLNGHDLGGRQLRVDSASNERARDDPDQQKNQQQSQPGVEQMHQPQPLAEPLVDAQTVINNVLCSLPPENLFDICKQLKMSLLVNPNETRQMLVQNPQLSFAILQTLVMIKAIDAQTAMNTLHKQLMQPAPLQPAVPTMMAMMQPQVLNPYAFVGQPQPTVIPQPVQPGPAAPAVVTLPPQAQAQLPPPNTNLPDPRLTTADPRLAPSTLDPRLAAADPRLNASVPSPAVDPRLMATDPRLSRQQHHIQQQQQQQQQQQAQQQQQQNPQQIHQPGWPFVGV